MSSHPFMFNISMFNISMFNARQILRAVVFALLLALFTAGQVSLAYGQASFTLTTSTLQPSAGVDPGGTATSIIDLQPVNGFDSLVSLSCVVTSTQFTDDLPVCSVSPSTATPPANGPSITITTVGATAAGQYAITVTGTSGSETETALPLYLNVVDVPQDYTLTISLPISPGTVTAGNGAEATVTVTPIASYTGSVTLSCYSVSPVVVGAPTCAFSPPTVSVTNGAAPTSVLTISTFGTTGTVTKVATPRIFYAVWLAFPALALMGAGSSGKRRKTWLGLLLLITLASGFLFLPSCNSNNAMLNNPSGLVTPKNTYTFTLTGVDENGVAPSNTTTTTAQATVTLTVN
ncbi:MAG: hypothetical protein WAM04_00175 [Candidatus Sulfotelmatobacter sp.]